MHQNWLQEAQIAAVEQANIVDAVAHHRQARQAQAEGEAAPFFGIGAAGAQHGRMHQAAGQQLHPAGLFAHRAARAAADQALNIELESGLDEGEKAGAQAHRDVAMEDRARAASS